MDKSNSFGQATQRILQLLVVFAVLLGFSPLSVGATLDSFTTSQPELTDTTSGDGSVSGSVGDGSDATMLGGARDISIDLLSGPTQAKMTLISSVGYISMSVDALSTARGVMQWDGPDGSINLNMTGLQTGDVGVDLSSGGAFDAFSITKIFADHDYEFVIGIYTNGSSWTEITYAAQATGTTVTDTYLFEHFSDASLCNTTNPLPGINAVSCGATPADTTNVGAVQLILDPEGKTLELDVVLDSIDLVTTQTCFASIGDIVWNDLNRNGIQDAGEPGIDGVVINLKNDAGVVIASTTTATVGSVSGKYEFKNLCAGVYTVEVDESTLPPDMVASPNNQGTDITVDSNGSPELVSLPNDLDSDLTIDFGYNSPCTGRIGDYVWFDENRNGIQDAGESGISGVTVNLKDSSNTVIATATTNANGLYEFTGLCAGDYRVEVVVSSLPTDYVASPTLEGADDTVDSNDNNSLVSLFDDASEDVSIDFGYNSPCTGRIGDYVWFDENRNGIQDAGESGIAGVVVNLKDDRNIVIATATTNANGLYEFSGLCAGDYRVEVDVSTLPANYVASPTLQGTDDAVDSNENDSVVSLLDDMSEEVSIDFGYNSPCTGRIGDYVWFDENRNGIQDAGESGIAGVVVNLKDSSNTVIATATTNANGLYEFSGLCAGDYRVEVDVSTLPANYVASPTLEGTDDTVDSNDNNSLVSLLDDMSEDVSIDFGYNSPCTGRIGDYVWFDENRNGIQDAGEAGISGVVVNLKDSSNTVIATATTNANGLYEFTGLCAGDYVVEVDVSTLPANYVASPTLEGTDDTVDSNDNNSLVSLFDDTSEDVSIDFGYNSPCTGRIGDYVWFDSNRNGIQDAGESGIAGVVVNLKDGSNTVIATATTNANGLYEFTGLCAGDYRVEVDVSTLPANYVASPTLEGTDDTVDSNDNNSLVSLFDDMSEDVSIDFGYNSPCSGRIGDYVWFDENRNGIQDAGESGIAGVVVNLKDSSNTVIATATTNANGLYEFSGLCAGDYRVEVDVSTLPADYVASPILQGTDSTIDSNENDTLVKLMGDMEDDLSIDFGYNSPCTGRIGDYVWFDENRNGIQDAGEAGISGVVVNLKDSSNTVIATATTNANGLYEFTGLCAGDYRVEVDVSTLPANYVASPTLEGTDDTVDSNDNNSLVSLLDDMSEDVSIDFGYNSPCSGRIGDYVWFDENRNGIQDAGEAGISGVVVNLKDSSNTVIATATTNANGLYEFSGLCAGDYRVEVDVSTLPANYVASPILQGTDDTVDSNDNNSLVSLFDDMSEDVSIDFGYNSPCTGRIGDYVWFDSNRNGIQDAGESGIAGVVINLKDSSNAVIATVTTNANGFYEFSGLCAGDYRVEADESTLPPGYVASPALAGEDPTVDSNINGSVITLDVDNDVDVTFDLGFNSPCAGSIGDYIWFDENRNGIQDAGEAGISGVVVNLKDSNNAVIATATTNADGLYEFSGLCAGDYKVEVDVSTLPDGYVASPTLQGGDDTADSNENGSMVTLANDMADDLSIDFGYNSPCTGHIGDYVWLDANDNGIQDAGEAGIPNVTLELKDSLNVVVATATTNSNGFYEFVGICAGEYTVEVDPGSLPDGVTPTTSMIGADVAVDSNGSPAAVILPNDFASDVTIDFGYIEKMIPDDTCKVCDGKVTQLTLRYNGDQPAHVKVKQNKYKLGFGEAVVFDSTVQPGESFTFSGVAKRGTLGTEITIYVDGVVNTRIHTSCSVPIGPGLIAGDFEVIEGYSRNGGLMCPIDYTPPPPPSNECSVCDGKATMLTLQYKGDNPAHVVVKQKYGVIVFDSTVQPGESFTFSGKSSSGTLGTEIFVYVDGNINAQIHTSCSVPIGPGLVAGDFEVLEAYSLNGGLMCPIDPTTPPPEDDKCDKSYYDRDSHDSYDKYDSDRDSHDSYYKDSSSDSDRESYYKYYDSKDSYDSYDKESSYDSYDKYSGSYDGHDSYDKDSGSYDGSDSCKTHYDDSYNKEHDGHESYEKEYDDHSSYEKDYDDRDSHDSYSKDYDGYNKDSDSSYDSSYDKESTSSYEKYDSSSDSDGWSWLLSWYEKYSSK